MNVSFPEVEWLSADDEATDHVPTDEGVPDSETIVSNISLGVDISVAGGVVSNNGVSDNNNNNAINTDSKNAAVNSPEESDFPGPLIYFRPVPGPPPPVGPGPVPMFRAPLTSFTAVNTAVC